MYKGNKVCPGCGVSGTDKPRFDKDHLCHDCAEALSIGRAVIKDNCREDITFPIFENLVDVKIQWYHFGIKEVDELLRKFMSSITSLPIKYTSYLDPQQSMIAGTYSGTASDDFVIPRETLEIARELCKKLSETCNKLEYEKKHYKEELQKELSVQKDEIFNDGVKYGRNLLFQLNKGEITLDDFNKDIKKYTR